MKARRMRLAGHIVQIEKENAYRLFIGGKPTRKETIRKTKM
jgi:hypothetical protein